MIWQSLFIAFEITVWMASIFFASMFLAYMFLSIRYLPCTALLICRSSFNIVGTVLFDISSSDDEIRTANRLSAADK